MCVCVCRLMYVSIDINKHCGLPILYCVYTHIIV